MIFGYDFGPEKGLQGRETIWMGQAPAEAQEIRAPDES